MIGKWLLHVDPSGCKLGAGSGIEWGVALEDVVSRRHTVALRRQGLRDDRQEKKNESGNELAAHGRDLVSGT
jgi:hypothetical protein